MEAALMDFISMLGVILGSALLGLTKKYTHILDGKIGGIVKPLQPGLLMAAGIGLPYLTQRLGIGAVDASMFVTAPTATIAMISFREGTRRLRGLKRSQGSP